MPAASGSWSGSGRAVINAVGTDLHPPRIARAVRMMPAFFGCVILALGLVVWLLQVDARRQIDEMGTAATDNTQWFLAHSEVEVLALQRAALLLAAPGAGADQAQDLRQRFDIFYSRIQTLQQGRTYDHLRAEPGISTALMAIQSGLDAAVPVIDGDDAGLIAGLPRSCPSSTPPCPWSGRCRWRGAAFRRKIRAAPRRRGPRIDHPVAAGRSIVHGAGGSVVVLAAMVRSAGERNRRIAAVSNRLNSLFEASIDAILVARPDGRILVSTPQHSASTGMTGRGRGRRCRRPADPARPACQGARGSGPGP